MKYNNDKEKESKINKFLKMKNIKINPINKISNNIKRNKTPLYTINSTSSYSKHNNQRNNNSKFRSNYVGSIYHINSLLDKMNSLKKLMYQATDLRSMLAMDKYGLKYSNDLRKNINSAKKLMSPHSPYNKNADNSEIYSKKNNNELGLNYYKGINTQNNYKKNKRFENRFSINYNKAFDLTYLNNYSKSKRVQIKDLFEEQNKDKKLYHLKTELFLLEQKKELKDSYHDDKLKNSLSFIRDEINKDSYYSQIKSKYKKIKNYKNKRKKNLLITMYNPKNFKRINNLTNNTFNDNNNMINIQINGNESDNLNNISENEKSDKPNFYRDRIKSYNTKKRKSKSIKLTNNKNIFLTNNINQSNNKYIIKNPLPTSPNLSIYKQSLNMKLNTTKNIHKISLNHLTNSNNSQENTSLNSINSSIQTNKGIIYPKNKTSIKIVKNNYNQNLNNISNNILNYQRKNKNRFKKEYIIAHINNIMNKSNRIKNNFINKTDKAKKERSKLFCKYNYNYKINEEVNINKINNYFKFAKKDDIDEKQLIRDNADRVKTIMDKRCSNILDGVISELFYQDKKLNKEYTGLSSYEKKMLKIKRENDIKKISNDHVLMEKQMEKDKILDIFITENQEIVNLLKDNNNASNETIEKIYAKSKVLKKLS